MNQRPVKAGTIGLVDARSESMRGPSIERAAALLDRGEIVGLPTETVYGIAASARHPDSVRRLWTVRGIADEPAGVRGLLACHLPGADALLILAPMRSAAHRRLVERLAPGPVTFSIEVTDVESQALCDRIGAARGVFEDGAQALFRCPTPGLTRAVLERARDPIVLASVSRRGSAARTAQEAREFLSDAAPEESDGANQPLELFDDGSPALGRRSTLVQLTLDGGYRVAREGAFEARYIDKQLDMNILFLCTGNTCRSPMAAAIARGLIGEEEFGGLRIRAHSAGIGAAEGAPATPEAAEAVRRMGIEMGPHSSTFLTRDLISQADLVFGMTRSHVDAARSLDPSASARIMLLDPDGNDIPDPIGMSQRVYDQTAAAISAAIRRRLAGIAASPGS